MALSQVNVLNAQSFQALQDSAPLTAGNNGDWISLFHRVLQGIPVLDVHGSEHVSFLGYQDLTVGEHPIDIKDEGLYAFEVFYEIVRHVISAFWSYCPV